MRTILAIGLLVLCGCTTVYEAQNPNQRPQSRISEHSVVNNTRFKLNVAQDGRTVFTGLEPGQILPVKPRLFSGDSVVIVSGYTEDGTYVGVATWTFLWNVPEAWVITGLAAVR